MAVVVVVVVLVVDIQPPATRGIYRCTFFKICTGVYKRCTFFKKKGAPATFFSWVGTFFQKDAGAPFFMKVHLKKVLNFKILFYSDFLLERACF